MKKLVIYLLFVLSAFPGTGFASDQNYSMCTLAGYYDGNSNRFLYELVMRAIENNRMNANPDCPSQMKNGKEIALKFSKPGRVKNEEENKVIEQAMHFSNLVYDSILSKFRLE